MSKRNRFIILGPIGSLFLAMQLASASVIPIQEYDFNQTGSTVTDSGSDSTAVVMRDASGTATDLHGGAGSGVSGLTSDRAFDNSASTGMGFPSSGGFANQADDDAIDGLKSLTLQGWYNTASPPADGARLFSNIGVGGGFELEGATAGQNLLTLQINSNFANSPAVFTSADDNTWVFFAVTYDSTTGTVNFYKGSIGSPVTLIGTGAQTISNSTGVAGDNTAGLAVGNYTNAVVTQRPLDGLMDDMRIYGSKTDSSGVLSLTDLEQLRKTDANIPEPATCALLMAGIAAAARSRAPVHK